MAQSQGKFVATLSVQPVLPFIFVSGRIIAMVISR